MPSSSGSRSGPPHSSQSTAKVEENGALHEGQRRSIRPPHAHRSGTSDSDSRNQRRAAPQSRQNAVQCPSTFRRSSRSQSAALPTRSAYPRRYDAGRGDGARGRAERLAPGREGMGSRPRGPAPDLPQHADHARRRGARPHPLPPGQDSRLVLHRPWERGVGRRGRDCDGRRRRRHAAASRHGRPHHPRRRAVADLRAVHGPGRRPGARARRQRAHGRPAPRADRDGQPPAGDAAGGGRLRTRLPDPRGAPRRRSAGPAKGRWRAATRTRA